ncbi:protein farnesyltransferase [Trypanosoma rangeli SC58]|uniref:Protein farnesyltransferase n=1 Tax=Trypanosoma rangeli SC58 TaxID=429131 RepID=A0A061J439_TRYRA|nr:protein farnesyltransferase [Trypanosoma rangeli SC58]
MPVPPATGTTLVQREVELGLLGFLRQYHPELHKLWEAPFEAAPVEAAEETNRDGETSPRLHRELHNNYVHSRLLWLPEPMQGFYSAQPWIAYWALQAADLLDITEKLYEYVSPDALGEFLLGCLQEVEPGDANGSGGGSKNHSVSKNSLNVNERQESVFRTQPVNLRDVGYDDGKRLVGFSGGRVAQEPHLAVSYAASCSLCILEKPEYLHALPRAAIKRWMLSLRCKDGSFCMHIGGEADLRASYSVAIIATLLQLDEVAAYSDGRDEALFTEQTAAYVASCQTHEGGFACGLYGTEAHGAYTQCGLGALILMRRPHLCNYAALRRWLTARQMKFEGGFNGRTNKLVDSCYSHWVGASHMLMRVGEAYARLLARAETARCLTAREVLLLDHAQLLDATCTRPADDDAWRRAEESHRQRTEQVEAYLHAPSSSSSAPLAQAFFDEEVGDLLFNQRRLLLYVLACCQDEEAGGLMDKPGCPNDDYHTCYSLSGISTAQNLQYLPRHCTNDDLFYTTAVRRGYIPADRDDYGIVLAACSNGSSVGGCYRSQERLPSLNPIFNLRQGRVLAALRAWGPKSFVY